MTHRLIKVESFGDPFHGKTVPKIRLQGRWLEALGFKPNGRVIVCPLADGEIVLKFSSDLTLNSQPSTLNCST